MQIWQHIPILKVCLVPLGSSNKLLCIISVLRHLRNNSLDKEAHQEVGGVVVASLPRVPCSHSHWSLCILHKLVSFFHLLKATSFDLKNISFQQ